MARNKLYLGKIDYNNTGRAVNAVDIEWELTPDGRFSASGDIWNSPHTDIQAGGQILDEIARLFPDDDRVRRIVRVWRVWHLNTLTAGTPKQENAVKRWLAQGNKYDYTKVVEHLKSIDLYEDDGYKYGSKWLKREIPADIKNEIRSWSRFTQGGIGETRTRKSSKGRRKATRRSSSPSFSVRGLR